RLYIALGVAALAAAIGFPLFAPAPATQGDAPVAAKPSPTKEEPKVWDGVVREFLVIGPLGRDSEIPWQIEEKPLPDAVYEDDGEVARWKPQRTDGRCLLMVPTGFVWKPAVLFAQVHIQAPSACKVKMLTSSADVQRVSVNGEVVHEWSAVRPQPKPDDDRFDVNLRAGWNQILVRLQARGRRDFEFYLSFKDASRLRPALKPKS